MTDLLLTSVKELLTERPQLRVILLNPAIHTGLLSQYFNNCLVLAVQITHHPVQTFHLEDILKLLDYRVPPKSKKRLRWKLQSENDKLDDEYNQFIKPFIQQIGDGTYPFHVLSSLRIRESEEFSSDLVMELLIHICDKECKGSILAFFPGTVNFLL